MAAVFVLSVLPSPPPLAGFYQADKLYHGAAYALMAFLAARAVAASSGGGTAGRAAEPAGRAIARRAVLYGAVGCFVFGLFVEAVQHMVPSREASLLDGAANGAGAALGAWTYGLCRSVRNSG